MPWDDASLASEACRDVFGSSVSYTPASGGGPYELVAIFDRPFQAVELGPSEVAIAGRRPVLDVILADLPISPAVGDSLTVDGGSYTVEEIEPDGRGGVKLLLFGG